MLDLLGLGFWTKIGLISALIVGLVGWHELQVISAYRKGDHAGYERRDRESELATLALNKRIAELTAKSDAERLAANEAREKAVQEALRNVASYTEENPPKACPQVVVRSVCGLPESVRVQLNRVR